MHRSKRSRRRLVKPGKPRRAAQSRVSGCGSESVNLFPVLFAEWEATQRAADDAWRAVWRKSERARGHNQRGATNDDVRNALVLRWHAIELLKALQDHLRGRRSQVSTI
jgi:hypothetical protein